MVHRHDGWWQTEDLGECPITLESFSTLEYPPFALYHPGKSPSATNADDHFDREGVSTYFDGLALASYIVSRGVFQNPLTRAELTIDDCRRLDRYLKAHCYSGDAAAAATIFRGSRVISVTEAFALRNSVSVETTTARSSGDQSNERDRERIRALQNAATAALAGLFVYGNDRRRYTSEVTQNVPQIRNEDFALLDEWGFDLSRQVEVTDANQDTHGYAVIDDDEAVAVDSQRQAYQSVQKAFPPLGDLSSQKTSNLNTISPDEYLMERIRNLSLREEEEQRQHAKELKRTGEYLLKQALERRKQRQKERADRLAKASETYVSHKKEEEELERARREIEAWRDDQWEKLRLLSEHEQDQKNAEQKKSVSNAKKDSYNHGEDVDGVDKDKGEVGDADANANTQNCDTTAEEKKKAKAAAKRKRAKERKKAKKALEKKQEETMRQNLVKKAQREASALKCGACGTGILKPLLAFERFDQLFCTPKCARTASSCQTSLGVITSL